MKIQKAHWSTDGDTIRLNMPLQKVDKERRIVSGFATVDAEDKHGDVVTKEASQKAFSEFLGNVRLMHQPIPAGKVLTYREEQYFDKDTNQVYDGIYVETYISKGAPAVWEMVLDGTLTGFSIGGDEVVAEPKLNKAGKQVRYVTSYRMNELSLVDNPANYFSNILSIQKSADGGVEAKGSLAEVSVENVFYCKKDHEPVALIGSEESKNCLECGAEMKNIGWFENDGGDKTEKVNTIIHKFESTEGGENMAKEEKTVRELAEDEETTVENAEEVSPKGDDEVIAPEGEEAKTATVVEDSNVSVTGTGEVKVDEAKEAVQPETPDGQVAENPLLNKMFDDLHVKIEEIFSKSSTQNSEALAEVTTQFEKKFSELATNHTELSAKFGELTEKLDGMEKRFETVEKSGAFKKSADLGGSEEESSIKKTSNSVWRGAIFS